MIRPSVHPSRKPATQQQFELQPGETAPARTRTFRLGGTIPPAVWNRLGTNRCSGNGLKVEVEFSFSVDTEQAKGMEAKLRQILEDLGLLGTITIEQR